MKKKIQHGHLMLEIPVKLRILGIAFVTHPLRRDTRGHELRFIEIHPRRWTAKVTIRACRLQNISQSFHQKTIARIHTIPGDARLESKHPGDAPQENFIYIRKPRLPFSALVPALHRGRHLLEERGAFIV